MARPIHKSLAPPGNEAEWARINREEEREEAEFADANAVGLSYVVIGGGRCRG